MVQYYNYIIVIIIVCVEYCIDKRFIMSDFIYTVSSSSLSTQMQASFVGSAEAIVSRFPSLHRLLEYVVFEESYLCGPMQLHL